MSQAEIQSESSQKLVPESMLVDLEGKLKDMDENLRVFKNESFRTQQEILESYAKEQSSNQKSLDHIERLQKTNFSLLQRQMSELSLYDTEIRRKLDLMPSYDALYSFTVNLIRKLRHLRGQVLERASGATRLDLELFQTQSSLLLAHAQIERQKIELKFVGHKFPKRPHSFHGAEWLDRFVKEDLNFYLPFKLHGTRISSKSGDPFSSLRDEEILEDEFLRLFDCTRISSGPIARNIPVRDLPGPSVSPAYPQQQGRHLIYQNTRVAHAPRYVQHSGIGPSPMLPAIRQNVVSDWSSDVRRPMSWAETHEYQTPLISTGVGNVLSHSHFPQSHWHPEESMERVEAAVLPQKEIKGREKHQAHQVSQLPKQNSADQSPAYVNKAPSPLRLGNIGQVKAIAATFDVSSAPNTPLSKTAPHLLNAGVPFHTSQDKVAQHPTHPSPSGMRCPQPRKHSATSSNSGGSERVLSLKRHVSSSMKLRDVYQLKEEL